MNTPRSSQKTHKIMIFVTEKVSNGLQKMAAQKGRLFSDITDELFMAAYTARCGETGDKALDAAVAAMASQQSAGPGDPLLLVKLKEQAAALEEAIADRKALEEAKAAVALGQEAVAQLSEEVKQLKAQNASLQAHPPAEREKLLDAANTEVANLSAEVKRLKSTDRHLAEAIGKLDKLTAENKALKAAPPAPALRIVPPTELGTFLASWVAEAGQVAA